MMKGLIIENSRVYRQLLDGLLSHQGFENDVCDSVEQARDFVDSTDYDIICVNNHLRDGSGLEFVQFCNKNEKLENTPIILLTSESDTDVDQLSIRVDEVVHKSGTRQIADQITHFVDRRFDPVFSEGKILFVEDGKTVALVISAHLKNKGYKVVHFTSAEDAWNEFKSESSYGSNPEAYDLILTDINLAGNMSGKDLVTKVRSMTDARGYIPIVAITGETKYELRLSLYQQGVNDFVPKPIMHEELLVRIDNLITNKRLLDKVHDIRRELFQMATTDQLTGCHNRRSLVEFSEKFIHQARRYEIPVSLMVIDLDFFKAINDNHGHDTGDQVLKAFGKLLNKSFREGDLVARFGGEEFVVLLNHCDQDNAMIKAEELRLNLENLKPADLTVTSSIGVTTLNPGMEGGFEAMFSAGDKGVYQAKENGRNQCVFVPIQEDA